ncbi:MAG: hypothetical protein II992_07095 [Lachnospiraceae bacterium]|nr:hypothetical protein [Lachnospiraceae bacterium]
MTEQEAIGYLKTLPNRIPVKFFTDDGAKVYDEFSQVVTSALAKQEPMHVKEMKISFFPHSTLIKNIYGKCPMCNSVQSEDNYCANCGQKLDFSIDKEHEHDGE